MFCLLALYKEGEGMAIPKIIYYTWFGEASKSDEVLKNISTWRRLNPDYQIIEINETNFDVNCTSFSKKAAENKKWAFVSDVARLTFLYDSGGFYFDTDVELLKPLSIFEEVSEVYGLQSSGEINTGSGFGSEKGSELIKQQLEEYIKLEFDIENLRRITNVEVTSNVFKNNGLKKVNRTQKIGKALILNTSYLTPLYFWGGGKVKANTIAIHHFKNTWSSDKKITFLGRTRLIMRLKYPKIEGLITHLFWIILKKEK